MTSTMIKKESRRKFLKTAGTVAVAAPMMAYTKKFAIGAPTEIVHWSWLAASDGEVWGKMIDNFNDAHKDKGIQIKLEIFPEEQFVTKV